MSLPHQNLVAWQRVDDLFVEVHQLTHQRFPRFERFELGSQLRRAAYSVPANIVEGIARGYGLHACTRLGYISAKELAMLDEKLRAIGGPLQSLINKRRLELGLKTSESVVIAFLAVSTLLF